MAISLLRHTEQEVYGGYDENLHRFLCGLPASCVHAVVKCHSLDAAGLHLAQVQAAKVIYTWRDLADATASFMAMFDVDFEDIISVMSSSLDLFLHHRSNGALILSYEAITQQPTDSVAAVASYLNIAARQDLVAEIAEANSFGRMREKVKEISTRDYAEHLVRHDRTSYIDAARSDNCYLYDPETLLHLDHIRDGSTGYGAGRLNQTQLRRLEELLHEKGDLGVNVLSITPDA
ncbi:sulfotransferase domain-containing protein [Mycobacterium sp.]|uniref:sulfotransferase domain-containing protein n=1 Tax=Mycobacterium sp. TaxID=1785 RepID=UPI002C8058D3|nr:sulfotransferase domain-containing protein [Mycobacterium sp.]HTQ18074.1 sulfotransferase domain-containing protein [Mycobacterium sp.]